MVLWIDSRMIADRETVETQEVRWNETPIFLSPPPEGGLDLVTNRQGAI